jgi:peptidoglycan/LPS O-acetylase OafA/YrhL
LASFSLRSLKFKKIFRLNILQYRKEIDGLRAIAVLPVMFFHAGFNFIQGGFYGVDVFFVISGYLITSMILHQKSNNNFSVMNFYERRARRILPALIIVMLACIPFAYFLMQPDDLENFGQSLISTSLMANNVLLYLTSGYWDVTSEFKPLLHTWSLGVEEQYYIIFPMLIAAMYHRNLRELFYVTLSLTIISFVSFFYMQGFDEDAAFYLLPFRFWELGLGACLAIFLIFKKPPRNSLFLKEFFLLIGMIMIIFPMIQYQTFTELSGVFYLIVCCGTLLIISFADSTSLIGKILGTRSMVLIGLMSYSLYLWHQPLFAFLRIYSLEEPQTIYYFLFLILSFPIAFFSWKIEKFFRYKASLKLLTSFVTLGLIASISAGMIFYKTLGFHNSYSELRSEYSYSINQNRNPDKSFLISAAKNLSFEFNNPSAKNLVVIGDSFSSDLINMIKVNNFLNEYEIIKPRYNCVNFNNISSDSLSKIEQADLILISYRFLKDGLQKKCFKEKIKEIVTSKKEFLVIGPKDYGYNINAPLRRKLYDFKAKPVSDIVDFNNYLQSIVPRENFIDLLKILTAEDAGAISLFSKDNKLITYDKAHLTYNGALVTGQKLFSDPRLKQYLN